MKKKIWIDGYEANVKQRLGSNQVAYQLLRQIEQLDQENEYTIFIPDSPLGDMPEEREGWKYKKVKPSFLWTYLSLPWQILTSQIKPDIFFSPTHYIPQFTSVKRVVTIFDLAYLKYPQLFKKGDRWKLSNWSKYSILNSERIITISEFTKKEIISSYHINPQKITVAYPGFDNSIYKPIKRPSEIERVKGKYKINGEYIIFIGTLQPRKNLIRLIEAFQTIDNLKLVIVGKTEGEGRAGWMYQDILTSPRQLGIEEKIIFTGFVNSEDLAYLLSGAVALALVSLWEGFGIPIIEAFACGVPVIASNVSSLPEVVGNCGLLVNPQSVDQIEQAIRLISTDKKLRASLSKKSLEQAKLFSWKKMAMKTMKVFKELNL